WCAPDSRPARCCASSRKAAPACSGLARSNPSPTSPSLLPSPRTNKGAVMMTPSRLPAKFPLDGRRHAAATQRNSAPIFEVLQLILGDRRLVLEIASGTGEHAACFAPRLPHLRWQPSDPDPELRASIAAWTAELGATNVLPPLALDAEAPSWPSLGADAVV